MRLEILRTGSPGDGRPTQMRGESGGGKEDRTGAQRPREEEGGALRRPEGGGTVGRCLRGPVGEAGEAGSGVLVVSHSLSAVKAGKFQSRSDTKGPDQRSSHRSRPEWGGNRQSREEFVV